MNDGKHQRDFAVVHERTDEVGEPPEVYILLRVKKARPLARYARGQGTRGLRVGKTLARLATVGTGRYLFPIAMLMAASLRKPRRPRRRLGRS